MSLDNYEAKKCIIFKCYLELNVMYTYYITNIDKADGLLTNSAMSLKFLFFTVFSLERPEDGCKEERTSPQWQWQ